MTPKPLFGRQRTALDLRMRAVKAFLMCWLGDRPKIPGTWTADLKMKEIVSSQTSAGILHHKIQGLIGFDDLIQLH